MIHIFQTKSGIKVYINGKEIESVGINNDGIVFSEDPWEVSVEDVWEIDVNDIPQNFYLCVNYKNPATEQKDVISIKSDVTSKSITIPRDHIAEKWNHTWNLKKFLQKVKVIVESPRYKHLKMKEYIEGQDGFFSYSIIFPLPKIGQLKSFFLEYQCIVEKIEGEAFSLLEKEINNTGVRFKFPPHLNSACEQYLAYFGQFLNDLGLESNTELKQIGSEIIFSVNPKNKNEALQKIHEAIQVFLALPDFNEKLEISLSEDSIENIKAQRLLSTIDHLKSQIHLANAMNMALEEKLSQKPETELFISSLEEAKINGETESKVQFFRGIIEIKKFEKNGFSIDFPKLITEFKKLMP